MLIHHAFYIGYLMFVKITCFQIPKSPVLIFCKEFIPCKEVVSFGWKHAHKSMPVTAKSCNSGMPTVSCLKLFDDCIDDGRNMFCAPPANAEDMNRSFTFLKQAHSIAPTPWSLPLLHSGLITGSSFYALSKILHSILSFSSTLMAWSDESAQSQTYGTPNCKDAYLCPLSSNLAIFVLEQTPEWFNSSYSHSFGTMHMHLWLSKC